MSILNNGTALNNKNKSYIVSIYPSGREYELEYKNKLYKSILGIFGNSIFTVNGNLSSLSGVKIVTIRVTVLDLFYIGITAYLLLIACFLVSLYRKSKHKS